MSRRTRRLLLVVVLPALLASCELASRVEYRELWSDPYHRARAEEVRCEKTQ